LPQRQDDLLDGVVMGADLALEIGELLEDLGVIDRELPQLDERLDNEDADLDRARRIENAGGHEGAVFGEGVGKGRRVL
jgi:hypothetical protein